MFVFVLYPYVYLLARTAFLERAGGVLEAARTLGTGPWRAFFTVSLPSPARRSPASRWP
jgi:iron(III) transport system permease protein